MYEADETDDHVWVKTGHVRREGSLHYGCDSLRGVPMESSLGHWRLHYVYTDLMVPYVSDHYSLSRISFALLEDSGHYFPDYEYGMPYRHGRDGGCEFFEEECTHPENNDWFCQKSGCSSDHMNFGWCSAQDAADSCPR